MDLGGLVVRWTGLGYAVAHLDHPLSTPLVAAEVLRNEPVFELESYGHGALLIGYAPSRVVLRMWALGGGRARCRARRTGGQRGRAPVRCRGVRARS
jgi:hypothetical protein